MTVQTVQTEHIGASIIAEVGDRTTTHWNLPTTVFSSSAAEIIIGLAGAQTTDRITLQRHGHSDVIWKDVDVGSLLVP